MQRSSNEMFYRDKDGNEQDAELWAGMLDGVDDAPEIAAIRARKLAEGWTEQEIDSLWPAPKTVAPPP